jgi:hypothetical protein
MHNASICIYVHELICACTFCVHITSMQSQINLHTFINIHFVDTIHTHIFYTHFVYISISYGHVYLCVRAHLHTHTQTHTGVTPQLDLLFWMVGCACSSYWVHLALPHLHCCTMRVHLHSLTHTGIPSKRCSGWQVSKTIAAL